jgi:hypothetical protein
MTDEPTVQRASASEMTEGHRRKRLLLGLLSGAVLIIGVAVMVLGSGATSEASRDLHTAQRRLDRQRVSTRAARTCTSEVDRLLPGVIEAANALLPILEHNVQQSEALVTAHRDQQVAGAAENLDDYNNAVHRGSAAGDAVNLVHAQAVKATETLTSRTQKLRGSC